MKLIFKIPLHLSSVLLSSALLWGSTALADIAISPMVIETQAKRGQTQGYITVYNQERNTFRARVYTSPFTYDHENGFQTLTSSPNDLSRYIQFSPRELEVPGTAKRRIRFIVRFPPSLPDGEYRTMIFTENLQTSTVTQTDATNNNVKFQTTIIPRIGVAVYVRKGDISPNLIPNSARLNPQGQIQLLVQNKGKASAIVGGNWTIKQGSQVIKTGAINNTTVIAEGERYLSVDSLNKNQPKLKLSPGEYKLSGELGWGENNKNKIPFSVNLTVPKK
ncbi:hypothetical protein LC608_14235 [Nostoc sp. XA010]|uniref:hypothetical protein n=1 Tax=Nostoc sp. XA010 TaxID=2780407 RepID=UPI001E51CB4C|nr:hypothetical protein [Nostoc sp. XA010]MCC5658127.1 hypothetical protein [Nostoc sp. XA010]